MVICYKVITNYLTTIKNETTSFEVNKKTTEFEQIFF